MSASEEECPVCRGKISNPSQPSPCCGKVFCQRCLNQSLQFRTHCPYCRSSVATNNSLVPPGSRRHMRQILPGNFDAFNSRRPVGSNIQNLLSRLQDSQAQQADTVAQVSVPNQAAPAPAPQNQAPPLLIPAIRRPVPLPRIRSANVSTFNGLQVTPRSAPALSLPGPPPQPNPAPLLPNFNPLLPNLAQFPLYPAPPREDLQAVLDDWPWQTEITLMQNNPQSQGLTVRTFVCPYCQDGGLDELDLRDHCNDRHANDSRRVVCPVCVATPHGDPQYNSRNFIGHLNLRHCYYMDDITNLDQSDEMNLQCAILASYRTNI